MWILSSIVVTGIVSLIMITALVANFFEDKSFVKKMDAAYEEMEKDGLPEAESIEKSLAKIHKTGSYRSGGRRTKTSSPSVNAVFKNYNDTEFKGTLIINANHNDEEIGKIEIELELSENAYDSKYIEPDKLNIHKNIWSDVTFDYEIEGELKYKLKAFKWIVRATLCWPITRILNSYLKLN